MHGFIQAGGGDFALLLRNIFTAHPKLNRGIGDYPVRILYTRLGHSEIFRAQIEAIKRAQKYIYAQNAYFADDIMLLELIRARRRGVDVRVIIPLQSNIGLMTRSNILAANAMLANGIRVFIYPEMSHVKAAVFDGWANIGSANFDKASFKLNKELNLSIFDPEAVKKLNERLFVTDMERSIELTEPFPERWYDFLLELLADHI